MNAWEGCHEDGGETCAPAGRPGPGGGRTPRRPRTVMPPPINLRLRGVRNSGCVRHNHVLQEVPSMSFPTKRLMRLAVCLLVCSLATLAVAQEPQEKAQGKKAGDRIEKRSYEFKE